MTYSKPRYASRHALSLHRASIASTSRERRRGDAAKIESSSKRWTEPSGNRAADDGPGSSLVVESVPASVLSSLCFEQTSELLSRLTSVTASTISCLGGIVTVNAEKNFGFLASIGLDFKCPDAPPASIMCVLRGFPFTAPEQP